MSDINAGGNTNVSGARQLQLNPERAPALIAKWQKLLGKEIDRISVDYKPDGVTVEIYPMRGHPAFVGDDEESDPVSVAAFKAAKQEAAKPSVDEAKLAFRNKFEIRLNKEFPKTGDLGDGSDTAIRVFLDTLDFPERRAMLMSNKQFKSAYPNGFSPPQVKT